MECDYCAEYCSALGLDAVEFYELPSGWIPQSRIDRHLRLVERRLECCDWEYDHVTRMHHIGPWHDRRGKPLGECRHCRSHSDMDLGTWDATLDHADCATCIARLQGWSMLASRLVHPIGTDLPPSNLQSSNGAEPETPATLATPADRARVARAVALAFGPAGPAFRWVDSPLALARVVGTALSQTGVSLAPRDLDFDDEDGDEEDDDEDGNAGPRPTAPARWWSAREIVETTLANEGIDLDRPELRTAATSGARVAAIVAQAIAATDANVALEPTGELADLLADGGQFGDWLPDVTPLITDQDVPSTTEVLIRLLAEFRSSSGPVVACGGEIVASERPLRIRLDQVGRLHAEDGLAIAYPDGFGAFAWHGVLVPSWVITDPDEITLESIDDTGNVEVRRAMTERFGLERLVREGGAMLVHEDETGRLWRRQERRQAYRPTIEPIVMVEVVNSTPEPDGSRKTYFLRVPPTMQTAREAVAWTFEMTGAEYAPSMET